MHIEFTEATQSNIIETGCSPAADLERLRTGQETITGLRAHCLAGADPDREQGWHDYCDALELALPYCDLGGVNVVEGGLRVFATIAERETWQRQS